LAGASVVVFLLRWWKIGLTCMRTKPLFVLIPALLIVGVITIAFLYWPPTTPIKKPTTVIISSQSSVQTSVSSVASAFSSVANTSALTMSVSSLSVQPVISPYIAFINRYYDHVNYKRIQDAYAMSTKTVPFSTYNDWYKDVLAIQVEDVHLVHDTTYQAVIALRELLIENRYTVNFTFVMHNGNVVMQDSTVLAIEPISAITNMPLPTTIVPKQLAVTNAQLQHMLDTQAPLYVLDAREDTERAIGYLEGSMHIRSADLTAGAWQSLPTNVPIIVVCWSGMRGLDTASFLLEQGLKNVHYLEHGAKSWVDTGGAWVGTVEFNQYYNAPQYARLITYEELKTLQATNVTIIDSRLQSRFATWHIPGSINVPIMYTPSVQVEQTLANMPKQGAFIAICDDFISCFDARIVGIMLEQRGRTFVGRYNKPWEYRAYK
jgi:rhodanese-related sulfurtransferase